MSTDLEHFTQQLRQLRVNMQGDHASPHKPCMLLAVMEMIEAGAIQENRILFTDAFIERYARYFNLVREEPDRLNPWLPYFHLSRDHLADRFCWTLNPTPGREAVVEAMTTATSRSDIEENIEYAQLDEKLHRLMCIPDARAQLREAMIVRWFPSQAASLRAHIANIAESNAYERTMRGLTEEKNLRDASQAASSVSRSAAFRRVVLEAYDYRCAATGFRVVLPDATAMVEAAHLVPFSESHDDSPSNGIALSPNMHWAMDRNVIAPGPDLKWHISDLIDSRIPDHAPLADLSGRSVLVPKAARYKPQGDALEWRLSQLMKA